MVFYLTLKSLDFFIKSKQRSLNALGKKEKMIIFESNEAFLAQKMANRVGAEM